MMRSLKWIGITILLFSFLIGTFYWFEAEKEVRILCSMFVSGTSAERVVQILETGDHLEYRYLERQIIVTSAKTLHTSSCNIHFSNNNKVVSSDYVQSFSLNKAAAKTGSIAFLAMGIFQFLLMLGFPYGKMAWGGFYEVLPISLRVGSGIATLIYLFGIVVLFESSQLISLIQKPSLVEYSIWVLAAIFALSAIGNMKSKSNHEKKFTPVAILLFACSFIVAMAG